MNKIIKLVALLGFISTVSSCQSASQTNSCDQQCLTGIAEQYMSEVVSQDWSNLPWGDQVRYTENNVAMMIGDGYWGAGPGVRSGPFIVADETSGNVIWFGITEEHGQAAYHGLRLKVEDNRITEVESYLGREGTPDLFATIDTYTFSDVFSQTLASNDKSSRSKMTALVNGYYQSREMNDGELHTNFDDNCQRIINGVNTTSGDYWAAQAAEGCQAQLEIGVWKPVDRIRAIRFPVIDEEKGIVVALSLEDHATRYVDYQTTDGQNLKIEVEYPNTRSLLEIFKIVDGNITRIEGVSVFQPYFIHDLWNNE